MVREQKTKQKSARPEEVEETSKDVRNEELAEATDAALESIDDVLDAQIDEELLADMDDVLEANAEEFVQGYVQQGGE